jgi:hypothetical protein
MYIILIFSPFSLLLSDFQNQLPSHVRTNDLRSSAALRNNKSDVGDSPSLASQCQFSLFETAPWMPLLSVALRSREIHKNGDIGWEPAKIPDALLTTPFIPAVHSIRPPDSYTDLRQARHATLLCCYLSVTLVRN